MVKVVIIESERGWGQRLDETKEFETLEEAKQFVSAFNTPSNKPNVPDWYMYAQILEEK